MLADLPREGRLTMLELTIEEKCRLAEVSRAGFYRRRQVADPDEEDLALRDALQKLVVKHHRRLGYRPLTFHLRKEGGKVNHKRVLRLMREDNLLSILRRKCVWTTDSKHDNYIYMNLAPNLVLTGINQLWVSDITYIRLRNETVFLAVVLDAYSRRVVGWELRRTIQTELPLAALQQALDEREPKRNQLVHHSDRGVQYTSHAYTKLLEDYGVAISMSRKGNPYDNARAERFMRTLKQEEVYATQYRNLEDAKARIGEFLENVYNRQRLHSALGYQTPEEFEATLPLTSGPAKLKATAVAEVAPEAADLGSATTPEAGVTPALSLRKLWKPPELMETMENRKAGFPPFHTAPWKSRWDFHRSHSRTTTV